MERLRVAASFLATAARLVLVLVLVLGFGVGGGGEARAQPGYTSPYSITLAPDIAAWTSDFSAPFASSNWFYQDFQVAIRVIPTVAVPEIDPAATGSAVALVIGIAGLPERRRRGRRPGG